MMRPDPAADEPLPTRMARRRLLAGRLVVAVLCSNAVLAVAGALLLTGPAASLTRFRLGFAGWAGVLLAASLAFTVPILGPLVARLLRPPVE
ncbi:MAG: hypothetical protein AABZ64_08975 [Nitrospinota bacterium]